MFKPFMSVGNEKVTGGHFLAEWMTILEVERSCGRWFLYKRVFIIVEYLMEGVFMVSLGETVATLKSMFLVI